MHYCTDQSPTHPPTHPPTHLPTPGDYYDRFVSKTLRDSTITVALMVPDPSGKTDMVRQVLVVLSGCPSDGDCVALISRFALHSLVNITIMLMPAAQAQAERYNDLFADIGPNKRFHNVTLLKLEAVDQATGLDRAYDDLITDILQEASKKGKGSTHPPTPHSPPSPAAHINRYFPTHPPTHQYITAPHSNPPRSPLPT